LQNACKIQSRPIETGGFHYGLPGLNPENKTAGPGSEEVRFRNASGRVFCIKIREGSDLIPYTFYNKNWRKRDFSSKKRIRVLRSFRERFRAESRGHSRSAYSFIFRGAAFA